MSLEILHSGTERTFLIQTSDSLPLLCHFLICLLLICLIRDAGDLETEFKLISVSLSFSLFLSDGKVYALGGMGADTTPQALVRLYEPTKDQWLPLTSMPTPRYGAFSFLRGNKIYVLGKPSQNSLINLNNSVVCQKHTLVSLGIIRPNIKKKGRQTYSRI